MCEYCSMDKTFWDKVVAGARRIHVLTPDEVEELYRLNPELRPDSPSTSAEEPS